MQPKSSDGNAASWFGIDADNARWIASCFTFGLISAAASFRFAENETAEEIADSIARVGASERIMALHEGKPTATELQKIASEFEQYAKLPLVGHRFSSFGYWSLALAQGFWLTGIAIPLLKALLG